MDSEKDVRHEKWSQKQQLLDLNKRDLLFKEREIWWCSVGMNIGEEVYGKGPDFKRPVLILKKLSNNSCIVLPITTKRHSGNWYYKFTSHDMTRWVMIHQIRSISANRFAKRQGELREDDFSKLKKSVASLLGLL